LHRAADLPRPRVERADGEGAFANRHRSNPSARLKRRPQGIHSCDPVPEGGDMADERKLTDDEILTTGTGASRPRTGTAPTRTTGAAPTATPPSRIRASGEALRRCVEPIDAADFLAAYWEQQPLVVARDEEGRFDGLISVADVERLV